MNKKEIAIACAKAATFLAAAAYLDESNIVSTVAHKAIDLIGRFVSFFLT